MCEWTRVGLETRHSAKGVRERNKAREVVERRERRGWGREGTTDGQREGQGLTY